MDKIIKFTKYKFMASTIFLVLLIVGMTWAALQIYNTSEIASPAAISEVHQSAEENSEFAEYLNDQKDFEAHFITLASSIKEQEAGRVTNALAITSLTAVFIGIIIAIYIAKHLMRPVIEAYESQERFIQDAAHELRNPLAALTAALQQADKKSSVNSPIITTFKRQTKRLVNISEDLLFLERREKQDPSEINLSELMQDVIEEIQPIASKKSIRIDHKLDKGIIKNMSSNDYVRLVRNILDNAVKYSNKNSKISVTQKKSKNVIHINITDEGIGIPKSELSNIGDRFFRATNAGNIDGTGLGIAIVNKILNTYGGSLSIKSKPNKGTTVSVDLPA